MSFEERLTRVRCDVFWRIAGYANSRRPDGTPLAHGERRALARWELRVSAPNGCRFECHPTFVSSRKPSSRLQVKVARLCQSNR